MSLLLSYHDRKNAVLASDDRACVSTPTGWRALPGQFPKITLLGGAIALGACGRNDLTARLMRGGARMAHEQKLGFRDLVAVTPGVLRMIWAKRSPGLSARADKLHVTLVGFDRDENRIRSFVWLSDDEFQPSEPTATPNARFFALGAFDLEDEAPFQKLTQLVGTLGESRGPVWVARQLRDSINRLSQAHYPIGNAAFFAALDRNGLVALPGEFEIPPSRLPAVPDAPAIATAGRYFVGSIMTPKAGAPDTTGNNDGGTGAQSGLVTTFGFALGSGTYAPAQSGNATVSNPGNAVGSDPTAYAALKATGNGSANVAVLFLVQPPGMLQRFQSVTIVVRRAVPTNSLNAGDYTLSYSLAGGTPVVIETVAAGTTVPIGNVSATLPANVPLANLVLQVQATTQGAPGTPVNISSAARGTLVQGSTYVPGYGWVSYEYDSTVTFTTATAHGLSVGQSVNIAGVSPSDFNVSGAVVQSVPNGTTFTINQNGTVGETGTGGTVTPATASASAGSIEVDLYSAVIEAQG